MLKNNSLHFLSTLLLFAVIVSQTACKKESLSSFSGENFLYFINVNEPIGINSTNLPTLYVPENKFSFLDHLFQRDTLKTNVMYNDRGIAIFPLSVQCDGRLANTNRKISIVAEGNGKEFVVMPHPDSLYIPAKQVECFLHLKIIRPPQSDTGMKTLTVYLKNNNDFLPENHEWNKVTYVFGNLVTVPGNYGTVKEAYGDFSVAKMYALQYAADRAGSAFWSTEPNAVAMNALLAQNGLRVVDFENFNLNELYYFMGLWSYVLFLQYHNPSLDLALFEEYYFPLTTTIISLTKEYISERKTAGNPVLDEKGNEIFFP